MEAGRRSVSCTGVAKSRERRRPGDDPGPQYIVYGLVDPRTLIVEYTGKSSSGLKRPKLHRTPSSLRPDSTKNIWLRELFAAGLDYEIVILGSVEDPKTPGTLCWWWTGKNATTLSDLERWWIAYGRARGQSQCNETDGGEGTTGRPLRQETREKIRQANLLYYATPEGKAKQRAAALIGAAMLPIPPCGTESAYWRALHLKSKGQKHCGPCKQCRNAHARETAARSKITPPKRRKSRRKIPVQPCGTVAAYARATAQKRKGQPNCGPCEACRTATLTYNVERRGGYAPEPPPPRCGTVAAYTRAVKQRRAGEPNCGPCASCMRASADYHAERRGFTRTRTYRRRAPKKSAQS